MNASDPIRFPHYAYPSRLWFEDPVTLRYWSERIWVNYRSGFLVIVIYWLSIYLLKELMRRRPQPYEMKSALVLWNVMHATISVVATLRGLPELWWTFRNSSVSEALVNSPRVSQHPIAVFWALVYGWCKLAELGDTAFLVLRKKNVTWLHLIHHSTVLVVSSLCSIHEEHMSLFRIMGYANFIVHSAMYTYFAIVSTRRVQLPRFLAMCITLMQIVQMVFFLGVQHLNYSLLRRGLIQRTQSGILFLFLVYVLNWANLGLFCNFFYRAYRAYWRQPWMLLTRPKMD